MTIDPPADLSPAPGPLPVAASFVSDAASGATSGATVPLKVHAWLPTDGRGPARAAMFVVHGMAEHGARYAPVAEELSRLGVAVYAVDLPGHGESPGPRRHFADTDGWNRVLEAIHAFRLSVAQQHPGRPLFGLGHSMGSFLMQHYLRRYGAGLAGAVLSASTDTMGALRGLGAGLMAAEKRLGGPRRYSKLAQKLSFDKFNAEFKPNRTAYDWIAADPHVVDAYVADPLCGGLSTVALWADLLGAGADLGEASALAAIPPEVAVLLQSGDADPVCQGGKGTRSLAARLKKAGLKDVTCHVYADTRHEPLLDVTHARVRGDLLGWVRGRI